MKLAYAEWVYRRSTVNAVRDAKPGAAKSFQRSTGSE